MLSEAACAFSTGELRLFSLWFKIKSNKTPHQMVHKKQACTLQRSHTRKANLFLTLCPGFLGPSHTTDTDSTPMQLEKTQHEEFCTHGHLLNQKQMASGRETQPFPPTSQKIINKYCSRKLLSNFPVGFKAGWGCISELGIFKAVQWENTQHFQASDSAEMNSMLPKIIFSEDDSRKYKH